MGNIFNTDFQDFLKSFNKHQVEYILVGGYAVILYGYHRSTGDMDVWVKPTKENYRKMMFAFSEFGLPNDVINESDFLNPEGFDVFSFGRPPVSIDIMTAVKGLIFEECIPFVTTDMSQGFPITLISYNHLISAKTAANRLKDQVDISYLEEE